MCSLVFAFYGIVMGLLIRNETPCLLRTVWWWFMEPVCSSPLGTDLLNTPASLRCTVPLRLPATHSPQVRPLFWVVRTGSSPSLWYAVVSLVVWSAIFLGVSALLMRRNRR